MPNSDNEEKHVMTVPEAGRMLGLRSREAAYDAAKRGEIPTIRLGSRLFVPRRALERMLNGESAA